MKLQTYLEYVIPVNIICKKLDVSKQSIYREIKRNGILKKINYLLYFIVLLIVLLRNRELIRNIEPKHHSLNHLTQEKVNFMFS